MNKPCRPFRIATPSIAYTDRRPDLRLQPDPDKLPMHELSTDQRALWLHLFQCVTDAPRPTAAHELLLPVSGTSLAASTDWSPSPPRPDAAPPFRVQCERFSKRSDAQWPTETARARFATRPTRRRLEA